MTGPDAIELIGLCLDPLSELYASGAEAKVIFDNARVCVEAILEHHHVVPQMQPDPSEDPDGPTIVTAAAWAKLHDNLRGAEMDVERARTYLARALNLAEVDDRPTLVDLVDELCERLRKFQKVAIKSAEHVQEGTAVMVYRDVVAALDPGVPA